MMKGNYGGEVGKIIALYVPREPSEKVIVHHYTDLGSEVQIEVERRFRGDISFSRELIKAGE